jgi:hypothetical protein
VLRQCRQHLVDEQLPLPFVHRLQRDANVGELFARRASVG